MRVRLLASRKPGRYDLAIERRLAPDLDARVPHYVETLAPLPEAAVFVRGVQVDVPHDLPLDFEPHALDQTRYLVEAGAYRTHAEALRTQRGSAAPYGHVELLVRYRCARAELRVTALPFVEAFASATDAGSGQQSVVPIVREDDALVVRLLECPARTLLRLHWPLEDVASSAPRLELPMVPRVRARRTLESASLDGASPLEATTGIHDDASSLDDRERERRLPADDGFESARSSGSAADGSAQSAGSAADKSARRAEPLRADRR